MSVEKCSQGPSEDAPDQHHKERKEPSKHNLQPLMLCSTLSLVISSIGVAAVMEAAGSAWEEGGLIEGIIISLRCFNFPLFIPKCKGRVSAALNGSFYVGLPFA